MTSACVTVHLANVDPHTVPRGTTRDCSCGARCVVLAAPGRDGDRVWFPTSPPTA